LELHLLPTPTSKTPNPLSRVYANEEPKEKEFPRFLRPRLPSL